MQSFQEQVDKIKNEWATNPRWLNIVRPYSAEDVVKLRGSLQIENTLSKLGSTKLWELLNTNKFIRSLGALTGGQALQQVKAGIKAIYLSGWQVAADGNTSNSMYPDQSLYPVDSVPKIFFMIIRHIYIYIYI